MTINNLFYPIMDSFSSRILSSITSRWITFPGLDDQAILDRVLPIAEEWVMMQIVEHHLSLEDQVLFRDAYLSAPDVFDAGEFLSDTLWDIEPLVEKYSDIWIEDFQKSFI